MRRVRLIHRSVLSVAKNLEIIKIRGCDLYTSATYTPENTVVCVDFNTYKMGTTANIYQDRKSTRLNSSH